MANLSREIVASERESIDDVLLRSSERQYRCRENGGIVNAFVGPQSLLGERH